MIGVIRFALGVIRFVLVEVLIVLRAFALQAFIFPVLLFIELLSPTSWCMARPYRHPCVSPEGWCLGWCSREEALYYWEIQTGRTQWEVPSAQANAGTGAAAAPEPEEETIAVAKPEDFPPVVPPLPARDPTRAQGSILRLMNVGFASAAYLARETCSPQVAW